MKRYVPAFFLIFPQKEANKLNRTLIFRRVILYKAVG